MEELDLKELLNIFWSRKLVIIIIIAIFIIIGIVYTYQFIEPEYQSTTTIILATKATSSKTETITTSELTLNQKLVSTYSELIKSKNLLSEVVQKLNLKKTENELKEKVSVEEVKDTDLIKISYVDKDPGISKIIVSKIAEVFITKVANEVYHIDNVQVWDKAEVPTAPYNINHSRDIIIFALIGAVVACVYALIANMLDTTVKSEEDIEDKIGLSVLTTIPICDFGNVVKTKGGKR